MQTARMLDDETLPVTCGTTTVDSKGNDTGKALEGPPKVTSSDESVIAIENDPADPNTFRLKAVGPLASAAIVTFEGTVDGTALPIVNLAVEIDAGAPKAFALNVGAAVKQDPTA